MCSSSQLERSVRNPSTGFVVGLRQASQEPSATCWSLLVRDKVTLATCTMWGFLFSQLEVFNFLFQHCGTQECCPPSRLTKCSTSFHLGPREQIFFLEKGVFQTQRVLHTSCGGECRKKVAGHILCQVRNGRRCKKGLRFNNFAQHYDFVSSWTCSIVVIYSFSWSP